MSQKLSKEDLVDLVDSIINVYDKKTKKDLTEKEHVALIVKFRRGINHPGGSDLIYYPELVCLPKNPTIEEIVDLALKRV